MKGKRLDVVLVEQGYAESRQKAQACIMSGIVYVDGRKIDKAGFAVGRRPKLRSGQDLKYVSRGGLKLEKAMQTFPIDLKGGGGHGLRGLHRWLLRLYAPERRHQGLRRGRGLRPAGLENPQRPTGGVSGAHQCPLPDSGADSGPSGLCVRGCVLYLPGADSCPALRPLMKETGQLVCLVKPQFEAGKGEGGQEGGRSGSGGPPGGGGAVLPPGGSSLTFPSGG